MGNTAFVGGEFTHALPPAAAGANTPVARTRLAAIDLTTGGLLGWNHGVFVKLSNGSGFGATRQWAGPFYGSRGTQFADVNGDGKIDAIAVNSNGATVRLSTGSSFAANGPVAPAVAASSGLRFADFTGDGRADAVYFSSAAVRVFYSSGYSFDTGHCWTAGPFYGNVASAVADVTGDRVADAIAVNRTNVTVRRAP